MDGRGYGRRIVQSRTRRAGTTAALLGASIALTVGAFGLLGGVRAGSLLGWPTLAAGLALAALGMRLAGGRVVRSRYRPDPWMAAEWMSVACGAGAAALVVVAARANPGLAFPAPSVSELPTMPVLVLIAMLLAGGPAVVSPPVVEGAVQVRAAREGALQARAAREGAPAAGDLGRHHRHPGADSSSDPRTQRRAVR
jgi:energy-coupling factor transport system permease protein